MGMKGMVGSAAGLAILLQEGIGDTIRVSLTPRPGGDRTEEVAGRTAGAPVPRIAELHPAGHCLSRLRPHHQHLLPADGRGYSGLPAAADAGLASPLSRCRRAEGRRHGMCRERSRRIEARQHRDFAPGDLRRTQGAGLRGRPAPRHPQGDGIVSEFLGILNQYVENRYGVGDNGGLAEWRIGGMAAAPTQADNSA